MLCGRNKRSTQGCRAANEHNRASLPEESIKMSGAAEPARAPWHWIAAAQPATIGRMTGQSAHDWWRPKLTAMVAEAEAAGIAQDVSVAVIDDLINAPPFNTAPPETDEDWNKDIGEPDYMVNPDNAPGDLPAGNDGSAQLTNKLENFRIRRRGARNQ
jgi:hypothetical protein